ncbi:MAG: GIY-YIG nuclease family protein [Nitrosomonas sp.]|nr:GIY-YIG nuclease family protein [Nitrosomonas sp.]
MLTFKDMLSLKTDILEKNKVKYVRHKDRREEYRELIKDRSELLKYQTKQKNDVFKECDYIASFVGIEQSKAVFIGMFKVDGSTETDYGFKYELNEVDGFDDFKDRLVIDWGKSAITWHQWVNDNPKNIIELLPKGYLGEFPGLLNFTLDYTELKKLSENIRANREWYLQLSSINGIYLILDKTTGNQYIGSAYGKDGIWQRWGEYAKSGHGGNELLKALCSKDACYCKNFQFTILQSLPSNMSNKDVISVENFYKQKLGTRVFGLNKN